MTIDDKNLIDRTQEVLSSAKTAMKASLEKAQELLDKGDIQGARTARLRAGELAEGIHRTIDASEEAYPQTKRRLPS
jgi:hypothetical protein